MADLTDKLRQLMGSSADDPPISGDERSEPSQPTVAVQLDAWAMDRLLHLLCEVRDDELSCEQVYNRLDEYVDCLTNRLDIGDARPLLEHHLGFCPDCREELDALVAALEKTAPDDPAE